MRLQTSECVCVVSTIFKLFFFFQGVFFGDKHKYHNVTLLACPNTGPLISHSEMFYGLNPLNETHRGADESVGQGVMAHAQLMVSVLTTLLVLVPVPHKNSGKVHLVVINLSEARWTGRILLESQLHLCDLQRHLN